MKRIICLLAGLLLLLAGCARNPEINTSHAPPKDAAPRVQRNLLDPNGNVVLFVSNQSHELDPVDIMIKVDGQQIIAKDFDTGSGDYPKPIILRLSSGRHVLTARSIKGTASLKRAFSVAGKRWILVAYWYATAAMDNPPMPRQLIFRIQDQPMGFD